MGYRLSKRTVLQLFCYFRQAERSIHYALSCPSQWAQFLAYYDDSKQTRITELIAMLRDAGAVREKVANRRALIRSDLFGIVTSAVGFILNPFRTSWSFSVQEISFFSSALEQLLNVIQRAEPIQKDELVDLRTDCFHCCLIFQRKLIGMSEIRKADSIEHWFQNERTNHITFHDLGIDGQVIQKTGRGWKSPQGKV